jgi:uncharacterized protein YxeA
MKKTLIILIIVAIVVVAAKMTVPPIEKHYEVASKQLASFVEEKSSKVMSLMRLLGSMSTRRRS